MSLHPRHRSRLILDGPDRAPARTYFKAIGFKDEDLAKPLVGVAHCWIGITPCNPNHRRLAERVKEGVRAAGGTPIEYNTIAVTDGIAMGTEGMKASLVSREVIGVIDVESDRINAFAPEEAAFLEQVAAKIARAVGRVVVPSAAPSPARPEG